MADRADIRPDSLPDESFVNSIIGEGTRFKGEFDLDGLLRIDGDFTGTVRTKGKVLVGRNGRAECTIYAGTVVVGGAVRGDIHATEKVVILSTALMFGNIWTPRMVVEEGVAFNGSCVVEPDVFTKSGLGTADGRQPRGAAGSADSDDGRFKRPGSAAPVSPESPPDRRVNVS